MRKSFFLFLTLALLASSFAMAASNRGMRIKSYVKDGKAITTVFNGNLFVAVCYGVIAGKTVEGEVITQEVKKLVVGDRVKTLVVDSELEMIDSASDLNCSL